MEWFKNFIPFFLINLKIGKWNGLKILLHFSFKIKIKMIFCD